MMRYFVLWKYKNQASSPSCILFSPDAINDHAHQNNYGRNQCHNFLNILIRSTAADVLSYCLDIIIYCGRYYSTVFLPNTRMKINRSSWIIRWSNFLLDMCADECVRGVHFLERRAVRICVTIVFLHI